jgi:hypothetical protein
MMRWAGHVALIGDKAACICDIGIRWRQEVSFILEPLYPFIPHSNLETKREESTLVTKAEMVGYICLFVVYLTTLTAVQSL